MSNELSLPDPAVNCANLEINYYNKDEGGIDKQTDRMDGEKDECLAVRAFTRRPFSSLLPTKTCFNLIPLVSRLRRDGNSVCACG